MDLSSVAPNSTSPRLVNSQLVSLPPVGILNLLQYCAKVMQTNFDEIPGFSKKFRFKWYFDEISLHFLDTYCFDLCDFWMIIHFAEWFTLNFPVIIRSSGKVARIFQTIICSSQKFSLLFIHRPRAFLKHSLLTEIPEWPFQLLGTKEAINLLK